MTIAATDSNSQMLLAARRLVQVLQRDLAAWSATLLGDQAAVRGRSSLGILMYHRVCDPVTGLPSPTWNVTPNHFYAQLSGLLARGFEPWPLRKVLDYRRFKRPLPRRVFAVTFDDGYANNYTQALPILRELRVPATIFLATGFIDSQEPLPFDDWTAKGDPLSPPEAWRALSLDQCRELKASGLIELGAHTHTHQDFRGRLDDFRRDLHCCREFLETKLDIRQPTFAFPFGVKRLGFASAAMARVARELGMQCSLNTDPELARLSDDPFTWGRFNVDDQDTAATIAGKLSGWFSLLRETTRSVAKLFRAPPTPSPALTAPLRLGRFR
jgi:peptidoglycan/xylan/chitin deacetylase (PgdA/CDA1 family)